MEEGAASWDVRLRDLRPRPEPIAILARVIRVERRTFQRPSDPAPRVMLRGWLNDGSATVPFTWWDPPEEPIDAGDVLRAGPVQVRVFRGRVEVVFSKRTHVEPSGDAELPRVPLAASPARPLSELGDDETDVRLDVTIWAVRSRDVTVRGVPRTLFDGVLQDASGERPFVAWCDFHLVAGTPVRIGDAYTRKFRDRVEVVLDERCRVEPREPVPPAEGGGPRSGEGHPND